MLKKKVGPGIVESLAILTNASGLLTRLNSNRPTPGIRLSGLNEIGPEVMAINTRKPFANGFKNIGLDGLAQYLEEEPEMDEA